MLGFIKVLIRVKKQGLSPFLEIALTNIFKLLL